MQYRDQTGALVEITSTKRVVSIVPSQSEFLFDLGLGERLIGVTKFCVHPKHLVQAIGHIGGTKKLNIEKIKSLQPDLIIGNKEENTKEEIEELRKLFPVWMSDIFTLEDSMQMMSELGKILDLETEANKILASIKKSRIELSIHKKSCLYFIWKDPMMVVGSHNFIHAMIEEAGFVNIGAKIGERYPMIDSSTLHPVPDFIFLSSEPFPFKEGHILEFQNIFPKSKIVLVDGEMFSWYGSRMLQSFEYFQGLQRELN